jgi:hypothetical protein
MPNLGECLPEVTGQVSGFRSQLNPFTTRLTCQPQCEVFRIRNDVSSLP